MKSEPPFIGFIILFGIFFADVKIIFIWGVFFPFNRRAHSYENIDEALNR